MKKSFDLLSTIVDIRIKLSLYLLLDNTNVLLYEPFEKNQSTEKIENFIIDFIKNAENIMKLDSNKKDKLDQVLVLKELLLEIYEEVFLCKQKADYILRRINYYIEKNIVKYEDKSFKNDNINFDIDTELVANEFLEFINNATYTGKFSIMPPMIERASQIIGSIPFVMKDDEYAEYVISSLTVLEELNKIPLSESYKKIFDLESQNLFGKRFLPLIDDLKRIDSIEMDKEEEKELFILKEELIDFHINKANIDYLNILLESLNYISILLLYLNEETFEELFEENLMHIDVYYFYKENIDNIDFEFFSESVNDNLEIICEKYLDDLNFNTNLLKDVIIDNNDKEIDIIKNIFEVSETLYNEVLNHELFYLPSDKFLKDYTSKEIVEISTYFKNSLKYYTGEGEKFAKQHNLSQLYCIFTEDEFLSYVMKSISSEKSGQDKIAVYNYIVTNFEATL